MEKYEHCDYWEYFWYYYIYAFGQQELEYLNMHTSVVWSRSYILHIIKCDEQADLNPLSSFRTK